MSIMSHSQRHNDCFELPAVTRERKIEIPVPEVVEHVVEVPHEQYVERYEESVTPNIITRWVPTPKFDVTERVIRVPKPLIEEKVIEIPQVEVIEKVVEVPQYVYKEKIIEVPRVVLQERIIPVSQRIVEEKIVEVSEEEFNKALYCENDKKKAESHNAKVKPNQFHSQHFTYPVKSAEPSIFHSPTAITSPHGYSYHCPAAREIAFMPGSLDISKYGTAQPYQYYTQPQINQVVPMAACDGSPAAIYRHVPRYVQIPIPHYRPVPVERLVDKEVPIPVELEIEQEVLFPQVDPKYVEVPVDIPYLAQPVVPNLSQQHLLCGSAIPPANVLPTVVPLGPFPIVPSRYESIRKARQEVTTLY